jgi:Secretion system C-terminal sorting domain
MLCLLPNIYSRYEVNNAITKNININICYYATKVYLETTISKKMKKAVFIIFSLLFSSSAIHAQTWEFVGLDSMVILQLYVSGDSIWAGTAHRVGNQNRSGLYFSTDSGNNWVQIDSALGNGVILGFDLVLPSTLFILKGGSAYSVAGTLYKSTNNGETWEIVSNTINSPIQWFGISHFNKNEVYAITYNPFPAGLINTLYKSTDSGVTWEQIGSFPSDSHGNRVTVALDLLRDSTLYAGVGTSLIGDYFYKSTDKGDNWFFVSTPPVAPSEIYTDYFIPDRIYLIGKPYVSNNGGLSWFEADSGFNMNEYYLSFYQNRQTSKLLYELRTDGLYSSSNVNFYWSRVKGTEYLPIYFAPTGFFDDKNMKNIFIEPIKKELFLGTAEGIYKNTIITNIVNDNNVEYNFSLNQNYPNPFNPNTTITYQIPKTSFVTIKVYDVLGTEVSELLNETQPAGSYEINFNAHNLSSGVYIYRITASKNGRVLFTNSKQMILMK